MAKQITFKENEKTLEGLQKSYDNLWDKFFHGDKESRTKPGNIEVYGAIARTREVAKGRMQLREELLSKGEEKESF